MKFHDVCRHWYEDNPNGREEEICQAVNRRVRCCGQKDRCQYPAEIIGGEDYD